jgi:hypothetical protein
MMFLKMLLLTSKIVELRGVEVSALKKNEEIVESLEKESRTCCIARRSKSFN